MKINKNLVLIGMMGSGKSTLGYLIAKKLDVLFIDIDRKIEEIEKMSISKIFKKHGEKYFRIIEEKITSEILKKNSRCVVSLGGGAFLNKIIRKEILLNHLSFWLNWDNQILANRIKNSAKRPLVSNLTKNDLITMSEKRSNIYSKAMYKINCNNLTKNEIVDEIINRYEHNKTNS